MRFCEWCLKHARDRAERMNWLGRLQAAHADVAGAEFAIEELRVMAEELEVPA